jgi:hypothetical protein
LQIFWGVSRYFERFVTGIFFVSNANAEKTYKKSYINGIIPGKLIKNGNIYLFFDKP